MPHTATRGLIPANAGVVPIVNSIFDFSAEALGELRTWLEQNPPSVSVENILGFSQFTAQVAQFVADADSTTSASFGDLAHVGPSLSGIPDGQYVFLYGCGAAGSPGVSNAEMAIAVNGGVPSANDICFTSSANTTSIMIAVTKTLSAGSNAVVAQYKSSNGSAVALFNLRWLIGLRFANS